MWIFITNYDVDSENLGLHGPASAILTISNIIKRWAKTRNFYSSNSNYQRCMIFTSRYMFSKQAKAIGLVRNRLPICHMATILPKNICDTISNNMKLVLINAKTNAALNLQEETVFSPRVRLWLQCICSKMTPIEYLGALATNNLES